MRSQICQIKGVGRLSSMCSCAPWAQNGLAIHHVIPFFVADRRNQPTPTLPERSRIKSVHTLLEERSEVRFDSETPIPAGRSHGTLSWTRGKWRTTKKDKEVCTARVDESGESFRVPDGLATEERGLRKYKLYRQACNTWNANDQSSRAKIVLYVRTCTCACIVLQNTPSHHISPFVLKSSFVIFLKSSHGAIETTVT